MNFSTRQLLLRAAVLFLFGLSAFAQPSITVFTVGAGIQARDIVSGPGGLWFTDAGSSTLRRINTSGTVDLEVAIPEEDFTATAITLGPDNNIWFIGYASETTWVGRYAGGLTTMWPVRTSSAFPVGITAGPDGNIWYAVDDFYNGLLGRVPVDIDDPMDIEEISLSSYVRAIAPGPGDGRIWFVTPTGIGRYNVSGGPSEEPEEYPVSPTLERIAAGNDGAMWVTDNGSVWRITTDLEQTQISAPGLRGWDIVAGTGNAMWITVADRTQTARVTTSGVTVYTLDTASSVLDSEPYIARHTDGTFWITLPPPGESTENLRIARVTESQLQASPTTLTFTGRVGGPNPASQTISLTSSGAPLSVSATGATVPAGGNWLVVTPPGTQTPSSATVGVNITGLTAGTYNANVTLTADALNSPITVPVVLTVLPPLATDPAGISFTYRIGGTLPAAATTAITSGGVPVSVTLVPVVTFPPSGTWLQVTPSSGSTPLTATVSVNPTGLPQGFYEGQVNIVTAEGQTAVPVDLTVLPPLEATRESLSFVSRVGGSNPASQQFSVSTGEIPSGSAARSGGRAAARLTNGPVTFSAAATVSTPAGGNWLSVAPLAGTLPQTFTVSVNTAGLTQGTWNGNVRITTLDSQLDVPVTLEVRPAITAAPTPLTFSFRSGGANPAPQTVSVSSGETSTNVTVSSVVTTPVEGEWLSVTPASLATPGQISVSVNPAGLPTGTYNGEIVLTASDTLGGETRIPVTFSVNPPLLTNPSSLTFQHRVDAAPPPTQSIGVSTDGVTTSISATASVTTPAGGSWLSVLPASGNTPLNFVVTVNPTGLTAGTYTGTITLTASSPPGSVEVPVTLIVRPKLMAAPSTLTFTHRLDAIPPEGQDFVVSSAGVSTGVTAAVTTDTPWLTVTPTSGTTEATFTARVSPAGLALGSYTGAITLTPAEGDNGQIQVPVTLNVVTPAAPSVDPGQLTFTAFNRATPGVQNFTLVRPGGDAAAVAAQTITPAGVEWLQISIVPPGSTGAWVTTASIPASIGDVNIQTRVDPSQVSTLPFGAYEGNVRITVGSESPRILNIPITLDLRQGIISVTGTCPTGVVSGGPIRIPLQVSGGDGNYSLSLSSPGGYSLSPPGGIVEPGATFHSAVTGIARGAGQQTISVTATDASGSVPGTFSCAFTPELVLPPVVISAASCPTTDAIVGTLFSHSVLASGGDGLYNIDARNLPGGLQVTGNQISGRPNTAGTYTYTLVVSSGNQSSELTCRLRVLPGQLRITTGCPTDARQDEFYSFPIIPSGGLGGGQHEITVTGLPAGLVVTRGGIQGTPTAAPGTYNLQIQVRSGDQVVTQTCPITVQPSSQRVPRASISCPGPLQSGTPISFAVSASGGDGVYSFALSGPEWLTLSGTTVSGTAGAPGRYEVVLRVADSTGAASQVVCTIEVVESPLSLTSGGCPESAAAGEATNLTYSVRGGTPPYRWELTGEVAGLTLASTSGSSTTVTGTPASVGEFPVTVAVTDATGLRRESTCTLRVTARPLEISGPGCPSAPVTRPGTINLPLTAAGGFGAYSWQFSGPSFLALSATSGESVALTGSPDAPGDFPFTIRLTDEAGTPAATLACTISVPAAPTPEFQFDGLTAAIGASESGELTLQLSQAPPVPLVVTVTLAFEPDVALPGIMDNPLVQFTNGQRSITLTIPAGQQNVPLGARVALGNVAGIVRLTISSLTDAGRQLLESSLPSTELRIPRQAPVIENVTFNSSGILIRGYSNTLDMQSVTLTFVPAEDASIEGPAVFNFTSEVQQYFRDYFQSQSAAGSSFEVRFPVSLQGAGDGIAGVVVTMRNSAGETATQQIPLR